MIVSRMAELARLDALLAALVRGEGGALVVHGEAGIGKTTLLDALVERCGGAVTVVRACGAETEAELAFSALTDLFYPLLRQLDALSAPQAAALMGALALEAPAPGGGACPPGGTRAAAAAPPPSCRRRTSTAR
jgi:predicted ATPase